MNNYLDLLYKIGEPFDNDENFISVKAGTKSYEFKDKVLATIINADGKIKEANTNSIEFIGLNSNLIYIELDDTDYGKMNKEITESMNERKSKGISDLKNKYPNKKIVIVRRCVGRDIAMIMGGDTDKPMYRVLMVHSQPITKEREITGKRYYGAFGYESIIIAVVDKEI